MIDGIAARIEDDVLTESEVRELGAFQQVVEGKAKSRDERIRELAEQWIVRGDAKTARFAHPSEADIDHAYVKLVEQFPSEADFKARCAAAGLANSALRRILADQLFLSHFLDYRFRPAIQIDEKQVGAYYEDEFASVLRKRGQPVPPLEGGPAGLGRQTGNNSSRVSLPAGHQQVEQDRAPHVLPHHTELAWTSPGEPRSDHQPDLQHRDQTGFDHPGGTRSQLLADRNQGDRRATGGNKHHTRRIPRRLELLHSAWEAKKVGNLF